MSALLYSSFRVKILRDFLQCVAEIIVPVFVLKMVFTCKSETENIKLIILPSWCSTVGDTVIKAGGLFHRI